MYIVYSTLFCKCLRFSRSNKVHSVHCTLYIFAINCSENQRFDFVLLYSTVSGTHLFAWTRHGGSDELLSTTHKPCVLSSCDSITICIWKTCMPAHFLFPQSFCFYVHTNEELKWRQLLKLETNVTPKWKSMSKHHLILHLIGALALSLACARSDWTNFHFEPYFRLSLPSATVYIRIRFQPNLLFAYRTEIKISWIKLFTFQFGYFSLFFYFFPQFVGFLCEIGEFELSEWEREILACYVQCNVCVWSL